MSLPNLSYMMNVGQLRYIQSCYEAPEYRNPDSAVSDFLSLRQRVRCFLYGKFLKSRLRTNPFYLYALARTNYYDEVFLDAVYDSFDCIINIGCGSDTRAYRFAHILKQKGVRVFECDQPQAIVGKQRLAGQRWDTGHVTYVPLDLNDAQWPSFSAILEEKCQGPVLVMMEGVSPYIRSETFEVFLRLLSSKLHPRSALAYDFKIVGAAEGFGRSPRAQQPFRMSSDRQEVTAFHAGLGFELQQMELSSGLSTRMLLNAYKLFDEDCLLRLKLR